MTELKFDSGPAVNLTCALAEEELAATIRYDCNKGIEKGDVIDATSSLTGEKFGEVRVLHVYETKVVYALDYIEQHGALYTTDQTEYVISKLDTYYDAPFSLSTDVKVFILKPLSVLEDE